MLCKLILSSLFFGFVGLQALRAEEPTPAPTPQNQPPQPMSDEDRRNLMQQVQPLMQKQRNGEALTDEDKAVIAKARAAFAQGGGPGGRNGAGGAQVRDGANRSVVQSARGLLSSVNVVDRALLSAALTLTQAGKSDEALPLLNKVIQNSPDKDAVGLARFGLGKIQMDKGDTAEADKTLRTVSGRAAGLALSLLAEPMIRNGDATGVTALFKDLMATQSTDLDRCRLLQAAIDALDQPGAAMLTPQARSDFLSTIAATVTYEQAMAAREALAKEKAAQPSSLPPGMPMPPMNMGRGWRGAPQGDTGGARKAAPDPNF